MKIHRDSELGSNESIKVTKRFRISAHIANTIYGNTKDELVEMVTKRMVYGDYHSLQEYRNGKWVTIGKFVVR